MASIIFHNRKMGNELAAEIYIFFAWRMAIYSGVPGLPVVNGKGTDDILSGKYTQTTTTHIYRDERQSTDLSMTCERGWRMPT